MNKKQVLSCGRERAVWMVFPHEHDYLFGRATMQSIAEKIGCTAETLRLWVHVASESPRRGAGAASDERARIKQLEGENLELRRANEILRKPSA